MVYACLVQVCMHAHTYAHIPIHLHVAPRAAKEVPSSLNIRSGIIELIRHYEVHLIYFVSLQQIKVFRIGFKNY